VVLLFGQLAAMCPKPKHLKHFVLEILVSDLAVVVEGLCLETFGEKWFLLKKLEGEVFVEFLFVSFHEDL